MIVSQRRRRRVFLGIAIAVCTAAATSWAVIGMTEQWSRLDDGYAKADYGQGVAIDGQGAVISAGYFSAPTAWDGYVVRRTPGGGLDWSDVIDNPPPATTEDLLYDVCVGPQDSVILAGIWSGHYGTQFFNQAALIEKRDSEGGVVWSWNAGATGGPWSGAQAVCVDASGNVYAAGNATTLGGTWHRWALWKLDPDGSLQSGFPVLYNLANDEHLPDIAYGVAVDPEGAIIVVGVVGIEPSSSPTRNLDWHVRKYAGDGTFLWSDTYSGPADLMDYARAVAVAPNGDFFVVGYTNVGSDNTTNLEWNALAIKYAKNGGRLWTKTTSAGAGWHDNFFDLVLDERGNPVIAGYRSEIGTGSYAGRIEVRSAADGALLDDQLFPNTGDLTFTGIARSGSSYAVTGRATNGGDYDIFTALFERPPYSNTPPTIDTPPSADTDLAAVSEEVWFSAGASDEDGDILTFTWDFGDGGTGAGAELTHAFAAPGTYTVEVTVGDGQETVSDQVEVTVGDPLQDTRIKAKVNFKKAQKDTAAYRCGLVLAEGFEPDGQTVEFDLAGVTRAFLLSSKGVGRNEGGKAKLKFKKKQGYWQLDVKLAKGDYGAVWADSGLMDETVKLAPRRLKSTVKVGEARCAQMTDVLYTAKEGKSGKTK